ncbi:GGDEF domain-containing protein [Clostridium sp. AM58-1XD]|uniref:GGDEF domain-containing protein n=1 Tax=Clostridium sp. AM58-1XD TaxID=2292307 RepID=UPI000E47202B|nr:GGDEF domain-containing protein [Clostridium sp. AM58-1XD]RGZ01771.1 diguanylate cyclase [Clostridium sp. AM58-1XD]
MVQDNCELLFEYLRSILYDQKTDQLDLEKLDEPYRKLGAGLQLLQEAVEEMLLYSADISRGNLSGRFPSRDNPLCVNLKNMHANLRHLTWQAKQVAAGDYSQHVSYLGEFSEAFNTMTAQLKEREALLKKEAEKAEKKAEVIEEYNELLVEMTRKRKEWILVIDAENRDIVYCNKRKEEKKVDSVFCNLCVHRLSFRNSIVNWQDNEQYKVWEMGDEEQGFFRITTFHIEWRGRNSYAHIVVDVTDEKKEARQLTSKAYFDPSTGIRNRLFFSEYMETLLREKADLVLCYLDMDGLKYVNDQFGHNEGDNYIASFVSAIKNTLCVTDLFARIGGDEFCVIIQNGEKEAVEQRFADALECFVRENVKKYPASFSYGVVEIKGKTNSLTVEEIIKLADARMYECKRRNKKKYYGSSKEE